MEVINPKTISSYWRKLYLDAVLNFTWFIIEPNKEIMKEIVDMEKKK